jgi:CspA family cold shock protein
MVAEGCNAAAGRDDINMPTGTIKYVNADRRWGFISRDDREPKVFVHLSALVQVGLAQLEKGQRFSFDIEIGESGRPTAANLVALRD